MADRLIDDISKILDDVCPIQEKRIMVKTKNKKWINSCIIEKIKKKDLKYKAAVFSQDNNQWEEYKKLRNEVNALIREHKDRYFHTILDENKNNCRELWKNLKTLLPNNKNSTLENKILFKDIIEGEKNIAEHFNFYFTNSIADIVKSINMVNGHEFIVNKINFCEEWFDFRQIDMSTLKQYVKKLKNVGGGESGISTNVFKDAVSVVANRILDIVNLSLSEGVFPKKWKVSTVIPIPKVTKPKKWDEYRPVNTVPIYEKLLELIVKDQLSEYCDKNNLIVDCQSGFRVQHSCETAIIYTCNKWFRALDNNKIVLAVFLDLRRAFETVNRTLLIKKLTKFGISGNVLKWFDSYLMNRLQKVKYGNHITDEIQCDYGVPQGTVLGPLLFILYMNDIVKYIKHCEMCMFADDMMLYITGNDPE